MIVENLETSSSDCDYETFAWRASNGIIPDLHPLSVEVWEIWSVAADHRRDAESDYNQRKRVCDTFRQVSGTVPDELDARLKVSRAVHRSAANRSAAARSLTDHVREASRYWDMMSVDEKAMLKAELVEQKDYLEAVA